MAKKTAVASTWQEPAKPAPPDAGQYPIPTGEPPSDAAGHYSASVDEALARHDAQEEQAAAEDVAAAQAIETGPVAPLTEEEQAVLEQERAADLTVRLQANSYYWTWTGCLDIAFAMDCSEQFGDVPDMMAKFILANPGAPVAAVLQEVRLKTKTPLLPNEDPRRVLLAVKLFRTFVMGEQAILDEDRAAEVALAAAAEAARGPGPIPPDEQGLGAIAEGGLAAPSYLGRALTAAQGDA